MKIYVASSWRNEHQPAVVQLLRELNHDVYDFRNPPNKTGFAWSQVRTDNYGGPVTAQGECEMVDHPRAIKGFMADMTALIECDALVYVLPCGRSASWVFGYAMGQGKRCVVLWIGEHEPELMFREAEIVESFGALREAFET